MIRELPFDVHLAKAIQLEAIGNATPHIQRRDTPAGQQPLVRAGTQDVDARGLNVDRERADGLDRIRVEERALRMRDVRDRAHVMTQAIAMRHPRDRHESSTIVDQRLEVSRIDDTVTMFRDA